MIIQTLQIRGGGSLPRYMFERKHPNKILIEKIINN